MFQLKTYGHFDFHAVRENICRNRTASNRKEQDREKNTCRFVTVDGGLRLRRICELNCASELQKLFNFCVSVSKFIF
jgi:hypothetical protein